MTPDRHLPLPGISVWSLLGRDSIARSSVVFSKVFLDGNNEAIWDVIDNPGLHPHKLANKIHAATRLRLDGRQVRYLIDNRLF